MYWPLKLIRPACNTSWMTGWIASWTRFTNSNPCGHRRRRVVPVFEYPPEVLRELRSIFRLPPPKPPVPPKKSEVNG